MDLDQVLIRQVAQFTDHFDFKIIVEEPGSCPRVIRIDIRPNALNFIKNLSSSYEFIIWSDKSPAFVNAVLDVLDPQNDFVVLRLYERDCVRFPEGINCLAKPTTLIKNRMKNNVLYVGSSLLHAVFNSDQFVPVAPYSGDKTDMQLDLLSEWLQVANEQHDISKIIREKFRFPDLLKQAIIGNNHAAQNPFFGKVLP